MITTESKLTDNISNIDIQMHTWWKQNWINNILNEEEKGYTAGRAFGRYMFEIYRNIRDNILIIGDNWDSNPYKYQL